LNIEIDQVIKIKDDEIKTTRAAFGEENKHLVENIIAKKDVEIATLESKLTEVTNVL